MDGLQYVFMEESIDEEIIKLKEEAKLKNKKETKSQRIGITNETWRRMLKRKNETRKF